MLAAADTINFVDGAAELETGDEFSLATWLQPITSNNEKKTQMIKVNILVLFCSIYSSVILTDFC